MDSNSLDKPLNFILNTLSRTLAPLEAINWFNWQKSSENLKTQLNFFQKFVNSQCSLQDFHHLTFFKCHEAIGNIAWKETKEMESKRKFWKLTVCIGGHRGSKTRSKARFYNTQNHRSLELCNLESDLCRGWVKKKYTKGFKSGGNNLGQSASKC